MYQSQLTGWCFAIINSCRRYRNDDHRNRYRTIDLTDGYQTGRNSSLCSTMIIWISRLLKRAVNSYVAIYRIYLLSRLVPRVFSKANTLRDTVGLTSLTWKWNIRRNGLWDDISKQERIQGNVKSGSIKYMNHIYLRQSFVNFFWETVRLRHMVPFRLVRPSASRICWIWIKRKININFQSFK